MLFYPGVMISRTRSRGGLMQPGATRNATLSTTPTLPGAQCRFLRFPGTKRLDPHTVRSHRFVTRGTLGWIETGDFDKVRRICVFSPGATAVFVATNTNYRSEIRQR